MKTLYPYLFIIILCSFCLAGELSGETIDINSLEDEERDEVVIFEMASIPLKNGKGGVVMLTIANYTRTPIFYNATLGWTDGVPCHFVSRGRIEKKGEIIDIVPRYQNNPQFKIILDGRNRRALRQAIAVELDEASFSKFKEFGGTPGSYKISIPYKAIKYSEEGEQWATGMIPED